MSVLLEFSIFPTDRGESVGAYVAPVVAMIQASGHAHTLTAMGTIVETADLGDALTLVEQAHALLRGQGCKRVYAALKLDIREGPMGRLQGKVESVRRRLGDQA